VKTTQEIFNKLVDGQYDLTNESIGIKVASAFPRYLNVNKGTVNTKKCAC
jgi:hypothetical protein